MATYAHLRILDVTETRDNETGEVRIRAVCEQVDPERVNLNLSKQTAETIAKFKKLKDKTAMIPVRHGVFNDRPFTSYEDGAIHPTVVT